jgi:hypothetical protein
MDADSSARDGAPDAPICIPAAIPTAAGGATDTTLQLDVVFAFKAMRVDTVTADAGAAAAVGFDLDSRCTCPEPKSCLSRDASTAQCDGPNGRDNALARVFNTLNDFIPQFEGGFLNTRIQNGAYTVLVLLSQWNGTRDDPSVLVTILGSQSLDKNADGGSGRSDPAFDGTDVWTLDPSSLEMGDDRIGKDCRDENSLCIPSPSRVARGTEGAAFVRDGKLVAHFGSAPIVTRTALGRFTFDFDDLTLVADIIGAGTTGSPSDGGVDVRLEGELIGRWPDDRALHAIGDLESILEAGLRQCQVASTEYAVAKASYCEAADLPRESAGATTTSPCRTVSSAISFVAPRARPASRVFKRNDPVSACAGFTDDCTR